MVSAKLLFRPALHEVFWLGIRSARFWLNVNLRVGRSVAGKFMYMYNPLRVRNIPIENDWMRKVRTSGMTWPIITESSGADMTIQEIRKKLTTGKPTVGTWQQLPSPDVAELLARSGYDWVCVDMEHGSFGADNLPNIFRGIECGGAVPFARLPEASKVWIKTALEAGAGGLVFPMIESRSQLDHAIDLATYPGHDFWREQNETATEYRGVGFCRANQFGKAFQTYQETAREIIIVAQIEHIRAVANIGEILSCKRLDAIMVGPYDLSGSMGITGQFENREFIQTMDLIADACRQYRMPMGLHIVEPDPARLTKEINAGTIFIAYGIDSVFLWKAAQCPAYKS